MAVQKNRPKIPLTVLGTLCFMTLFMCQTQFKIAKEISEEVYPPVISSKDSWFLYTIADPSRLKCGTCEEQSLHYINYDKFCARPLLRDRLGPRLYSAICPHGMMVRSPLRQVFGIFPKNSVQLLGSHKHFLQAFFLITSPVMSFIATALLLFGESKSNPYFFIPWLFLTLKGFLLIQTGSMIGILKDLAFEMTFDFRIETLKLIVMYFTIFIIDLVELLSFWEIFDLFLRLWNNYPRGRCDAVKTMISDISETFSQFSLGSLSSISLVSLSESEHLEPDAKATQKTKLPLKDGDQNTMKSLPVGDTAIKVAAQEGA